MSTSCCSPSDWLAAATCWATAKHITMHRQLSPLIWRSVFFIFVVNWMCILVIGGLILGNSDICIRSSLAERQTKTEHNNQNQNSWTWTTCWSTEEEKNRKFIHRFRSGSQVNGTPHDQLTSFFSNSRSLSLASNWPIKSDWWFHWTVCGRKNENECAASSWLDFGSNLYSNFGSCALR